MDQIFGAAGNYLQHFLKFDLSSVAEHKYSNQFEKVAHSLIKSLFSTFYFKGAGCFEREDNFLIFVV